MIDGGFLDCSASIKRPVAIDRLNPQPIAAGRDRRLQGRPLKLIRRALFFRETSCATMKAERPQGVTDVASPGEGQ
jgi:hypothetical protein